MLLLILGLNSLTVMAAPPDERHANRTIILCWSGMTDTEQSITSGSNEEGLKRFLEL